MYSWYNLSTASFPLAELRPPCSIFSTTMGRPMTQWIGFRKGMMVGMPSIFRPQNIGMVMPSMSSRDRCSFHNSEPGSIRTTLYVSVSPNARTGTSAAPWFKATFKNPLRRFIISFSVPGLAKMASLAPPGMMSIALPSPRSSTLLHARQVTLHAPMSLLISLKKGGRKLMPTVMVRMSMPGNNLENFGRDPSVAKADTTPQKSTPCGW
mmetsp:Transcript_3705/g.9342  ORF Transcript_3705/g.9342 Transcript_3705/m.9342 type:complete len:209 (-) Transcript_3705:96-722(-)